MKLKILLICLGIIKASVAIGGFGAQMGDEREMFVRDDDTEREHSYTSVVGGPNHSYNVNSHTVYNNGSYDNQASIQNNQTGRTYSEQTNYNDNNGVRTANTTVSNGTSSKNYQITNNNGSRTVNVTNSQTGKTTTYTVPNHSVQTNNNPTVINVQPQPVYYPGYVEPYPYYYGAGVGVVVPAGVTVNNSNPAVNARYESSGMESGEKVFVQ